MRTYIFSIWEKAPFNLFYKQTTNMKWLNIGLFPYIGGPKLE